MNAMRAANFTGVIICLPLLIHLWGVLNAGTSAANIPLAISQTLNVLWLLQITAIFLATPWFMREHSLTDCLLANMVMTLIALPFLCLAWLAAALSVWNGIKILLLLTGISLIAISLVWPCQRWKIPFRLDMLLCLLATMGLWMKSDQWLIWLQ